MDKQNQDLYKINQTPELVEDDHYTLLTQVLFLSGIFEKIATKEVSSELSFTQIKILNMINSNICTKSSEFAVRFNVSKANMTGMIGRLEKNGYLTREECESDYRVKILKLTDKGREYIANNRPKFFDIVNETLTSLDPEQVRQTNACLSQCIDGLRGIINI